MHQTAAAARIQREHRHPLIAVDQRHLKGPFDIIGDVHGCVEEVNALFGALRYARDAQGIWRSPDGRLPIFVGDLVDRGPYNVAAVELVSRMVANDAALAVVGNHDVQLERYLSGEPVPLLYGLEGTVREFEAQPAQVREAAREFFGTLPGHLLLDDGRLVIAHTGLAEEMHGVTTPECRHLAAYGVHDDSVDPRDIAARHPWIAGYTGAAAVVYGHTPVLEATWRGQTIGVDTGCVFGWRLTALRWPERTLVSVPAEEVYARRRRPFLPEPGAVQSA